MNYVEEVRKYVMEKIQWHKETAEDHFDFWNEHIKYVYKEAEKLAIKYNADIEIVKIGALLHDIALINMVGTKKDHHINGAKITEDFLTSINYPKSKTEKVVSCVYNHRSSKNATNIEEICVADADILAHFDNIPMVFDIMFNVRNMQLAEGKKELEKYLEKDFNDLSDKTKEIFKDRYEVIKDVLIAK